MFSRRPIRIAGSAFLLGALAIVPFVVKRNQSESTAPTPARVANVVVAQPVTQRIVEWDEYTGRLEPIEFVEVRARVGGYLQEIHFVEGQIVRAGDLLAVIDRRPYAAAVRRAKAAVEEARAQLAQSESVLWQRLAEKKEADAQLTLATQRFRRAEKLVGTGAIAKEEFDLRESALTQARALTESADAAIASTRAAIEVASAAVGSAEAALDSAEIQLNYTQVKAPVSGRVSSRAVTVGNLISGGSADATLLTTIVSLDPIHVTFDADEAAFLKYQRLAADERELNLREAKLPVYLALADESDFPRRGHMDFVDNRMDPSTGTMRGRAILRNEDFLLTPGLFARVRLPGSAAYDAVLVPDLAIVSDQSEKFVYVVAPDGAIRRQQVRIGGVSHGLRIVRDGLEGDERIITRGLQRVRPGLKAKATQETLIAGNDVDLPDSYAPVPKTEWISRDESYLPPGDSAANSGVARTAQALDFPHAAVAAP